MSVYFKPLEISDLRLSPSLSEEEHQRRVAYYYRQKEHEEKLTTRNYMLSEYHATLNRLMSVNVARPDSISRNNKETEEEYYPRATHLLAEHLKIVTDQRFTQISNLMATYRDMGGSGYEELSSYASPEQVYNRLKGLEAAIQYLKEKKAK